tara:strand:+ start:188 stop:418 length:231 start_codon:yes stop_codon:yes gene_type:complete
VNISEIQKINMFDKYVMRGGLDTLDTFETICQEVLTMIGVYMPKDSDMFNDVVTRTIRDSIREYPTDPYTHRTVIK